MTHLFNSRRRCVPSLGSQARLGQEHTGDLQKECCTNQGFNPRGYPGRQGWRWWALTLSGDPKPDLDALLFAYRSAWLPHEPDQIQFGSSETRASLDGQAAKMLTAFLASPAASVRGRVLGVEEEIRSMLVEGVPDLYGRVDLLTEDHDRVTITDIKTSRGKWSAEQVEDSGEQLLLYSKLASEIAPGKLVQTRFLVLTKTKEPVVEEHVREIEPGNLARTLAGVERVWRAVQSGVFYPAPSVMSCSGCGYRAACRAWGG